MGWREWFGFSKPRDAPQTELPQIEDNVRDSGGIFVFGQTLSGERVDEKSALQIATVYACVRLLAETVASLPLHLYKFTEKGEVSVICSLDGERATIKVADTGIGIKDSDREKLFKPFSQLDTGLTRQYEGTGLGLSISKRLVELMDGTISVESEPGKGTEFTISIPLSLIDDHDNGRK